MENNEKHLFPFIWKIADGYPASEIKYHGCKVFGTFICGGGSSMGYKLAGYNHIGGVEVDPKVAETYKINHHPEYLYVMDIREFNKLQDLPEELYNLDILDGSPPCTTFSTAGKREKTWGKTKKFAEGQKDQVLDDLVFVYCDTIIKLRPKCFVLENVSGLIKGNAKSYAKRIVEKMNANGYEVQVFLLNAALMGVPQSRERVFFIGHKKEYKLPRLVLDFKEEPITFGNCVDHGGVHPRLNAREKRCFDARKYGDKDFSDVVTRLDGKTNSYFNSRFLYEDKVCGTLASRDAQNRQFYHFDRPWKINDKEMLTVSTFPQDYLIPTKNIGFFLGMSVPPVMMAQISNQIYIQWLSKIK